MDPSLPFFWGLCTLRVVLWALVMGPFDSGVCSMGPVWYMVYIGYALGSRLGAVLGDYRIYFAWRTRQYGRPMAWRTWEK